MPQVSTIKKILLVTLFLLPFEGYSQRIDSSYYYDKSLMMVTSSEKKEKVVQSFFTREGVDLIEKNTFEYSFMDKQFDLQRVIRIQDRRVFEDFWQTETDTVYNEFVSGPDYDKCVKNFYQFVAENVKYPDPARNNGIQGNVIVSFIVDKSGMISNIMALTKYGFGLEEEVLRAVGQKKSFGPVFYKERPVNVYLRIPINFQLSE